MKMMKWPVMSYKTKCVACSETKLGSDGRKKNRKNTITVKKRESFLSFPTPEMKVFI